MLFGIILSLLAIIPGGEEKKQKTISTTRTTLFRSQAWTAASWASPCSPGPATWPPGCSPWDSPSPSGQCSQRSGGCTGSPGWPRRTGRRWAKREKNRFFFPERQKKIILARKSYTEGSTGKYGTIFFIVVPKTLRFPAFFSFWLSFNYYLPSKTLYVISSKTNIYVCVPSCCFQLTPAEEAVRNRSKDRTTTSPWTTVVLHTHTTFIIFKVYFIIAGLIVLCGFLDLVSLSPCDWVRPVVYV